MWGFLIIKYVFFDKIFGDKGDDIRWMMGVVGLLWVRFRIEIYILLGFYMFCF